MGMAEDDPRLQEGGVDLLNLNPDELLAEAQQPVDDFLGVEPGFTARRQARPRTDPAGEQFGFIDVPPTFTESDLDLPAQRGPEQIARLKIQMVNLGILPRTEVNGVWDDTAKVAYRNLLSTANRHGLRLRDDTRLPEADIIDFIERANVRAEELAEAEGILPQQRSVNPVDLQEGLRQTFIEMTGQGPEQEVLDRMAQAYAGVEDPTSGTPPPSVQNFARQQIRSQFPQEVAGQDFVDRSFEFFSLLDGV